MATDYTDWLDGEPILQAEGSDGSFTEWIDGEPVIRLSGATVLVVAECHHLHDSGNLLLNGIFVDDAFHTHAADTFWTYSGTLYVEGDYLLHDVPEMGFVFKTDFSEYSTGIQPSDWSGRWDTSGQGFTVEDSTWDAKIGKRLFLDNVSTGDHFAAWDDLDSIGADVEILALINVPLLDASASRLIARGSGGDGTEYGYMLKYQSNALTIVKKINGSSIVVQASAALNAENNHYYWWRFRVRGTSIKGKIWGWQFEEPDEWTVEGTDSDVSDAGWNGLGTYLGGGDLDCFYFACAGGESSPSVGNSGLIAPNYFGPLEIGNNNHSYNVDWARAWGFEPPDGGFLYSLDLYQNDNYDTIRVALYQGGNLSTGPEGATLIKDYGLHGAGWADDAWHRVNFGPLDVSGDEPLWLALKGDSGWWTRYTGEDGDHGNFDAAGYYNSTAVSKTKTVAWAATWPSDGGSFVTTWPAVRLYIKNLPIDLAVQDAYHLHDADNLILTPLYFETDFSEYTTSVQPSDWTERWDTTPISSTVEAVTWEHALGKKLWINNDAQQRALTSWDDLDSISADVEILTLLKSSKLYNQGVRVHARCSGGVATETSYHISLSSGQLQIAKYVAGASSPIATAESSLGSSADGPYWIRFRVNGDDLKVKIWSYNNVEPYDWAIETTDSSVPDAGWNGIGSFTAISDIYVYYFACATDGGSPAIPSAFRSADNFGSLLPLTTPNYASANFTRLMGGQVVDADYLYGASVYCGITHAEQCRVAIYSGGSLVTGPDGATLLVDLGETSGSETYAWMKFMCGRVAIPAGEPLWLAFKGDYGAGFYFAYTNDELDGGNFQTARGRYDSTVVSTDHAVAFPATWPTDGGSFGASWYIMEIFVDPIPVDLVVADSDHLHDADNVVVTTAIDLVIPEAYHLHDAESIYLAYLLYDDDTVFYAYKDSFSEVWKEKNVADFGGWATESVGSDRWFKIWLLDASIVTSLRIKGTVVDPDRLPDEPDLYGSNNGTNWTLITSNLNVLETTALQTFHFENSTPYVFYKLGWATNISDNTFDAIDTLSLFGRKSGGGNTIINDSGDTYSAWDVTWGAAAQVADNSLVTFWQSEGVDPDSWFQIQLTSAKVASALKLFPRGSQSDRLPDNFTILGSNNGSDWDTLDTGLVLEGNVGDQWTFITFPNTTPYSYYKITFSEVIGTDNYETIAEFDLLNEYATDLGVDSAYHLHDGDNVDLDGTFTLADLDAFHLHDVDAADVVHRYLTGNTVVGGENVQYPPPENKAVCRYQNTHGVAIEIDKYTGYWTVGNAATQAKAVVYSDDSGSPDELIGTSDELTNIPSAAHTSFTFSTTVHIPAGSYFWIGVHVLNMLSSSHCSNLSNGIAYNEDTYADGPSDPFGTPVWAAFEYEHWVTGLQSTTEDLIIADNFHLHDADNLVITTGGAITLADLDAYHLHDADNVDLLVDFWRLSVTSVVIGSFQRVAVPELQMRTSKGGADVCADGIAKASSESNPASYAFDDNGGTQWLTPLASFPEWIEYQFTSPVDIVEFTILAPGGAWLDYCPDTFKLQHKVGGSWTDVFSEVDVSWVADEFKVFPSSVILADLDAFHLHDGENVALVHMVLFDAFDGTNDDPPNVNLWTPYGDDTVPDIQSNKVQISTHASGSTNNEGIASKFMLTGDFDVIISFDYVHAAVNGYRGALYFHIDADHHVEIGMQYSGASREFWHYYDYDSGESSNSIGRTNDSGKLRIVRTGSDITCYYRDGSGDWTSLGTTKAVGSGDGTISVFSWNWTGNPAVPINFDDMYLDGDWYIYELVVNDASHLHDADAPILVTDHYLAVAECYHEIFDDGPLTLQAGLTLVVDECFHLHDGDNVALTQDHDLVVNECDHLHDADPANVTESHDLVVAECFHLHDADECLIPISLQVAECYHAHDGPNLTLGAADLAAAEECFHLHDADNIVLTYSVTLQVSETFHLHDADASILECGQTLVFFQAVGTKDDTDYSYTAGNNRMWFDAKKAFPNQTFCRFQVVSQPSFASDITNMSVGYRKGVVEFGDDFSDTPEIILFGGSQGYSLAADESKWSDWLQFPLADSPTGEILFNVYFDAQYYMSTWGVYNAQQYKNLVGVDDCLTEVVSYSSSNSERIIWAIEVKPPTVTTLVIAGDDLLHYADAIATLNKVIPNVHQAFLDVVSDPVALIQVHELTIAGDDLLHYADNLAMWSNLVVTESDHLHFADNIDLVQITFLVVDESYHLHDADAFPIVQRFTLAIDESSHLHDADGLILAQEHALAVNPCDHLHDADGLVITQDHALAVAECHHLHDVDSFNITIEMPVDESDHLHAADNIALTQEHSLVVQESHHLHAADDFWIVQLFDLAIDESDHDVDSDTFPVVQEHSLSVVGAAHLHFVDALLVTQDHYLYMDAGYGHAYHLHDADNVVIAALSGVLETLSLGSITPVHIFKPKTISRSFRSVPQPTNVVDIRTYRSLTTRRSIKSLSQERMTISA